MSYYPIICESSLQEREKFGYWLSGFIDGEGCFILHRSKNGLYARLQIEVRLDDLSVIKEIKKFFGCGRLCIRERNKRNPNNKPQVGLLIGGLWDLKRKVLPILETFPLRAKKQRDFLIWKKGVNLIYSIAMRPKKRRTSSWNSQDHEEFQTLVDALKTTRKYKGPEASPVAIKEKIYKRTGFFSAL